MSTPDTLKPWRVPQWRLERFLITSDRARCDSKEPTMWQRAFELAPYLQCEKLPTDFALWIALLRLATVASMPSVTPVLIEAAAYDDET